MLPSLGLSLVLLAAQGSSHHAIAPSVTKGSVNTASGRVPYKATASQINLLGDNGEVECRMFYVAYEKETTEKRPVTFCFNGGPGSASLWLHMGGMGPKRAPMPDDGSLPRPPYNVEDSDSSWLDFTDLVFIDAPNTGYSRIARNDLNSKYLGVRPDISAFTNFIKKWLSEHNRWDSPLFIAGESYGGIRGSGLTKSLFDAGIAVHGFISISGVNHYMTLREQRGNVIPYIGFFPTFTATAWYHKKLNPRFKTVEQAVEESKKFVAEEYGNALLKGDSLTPAERDRIATKMAELSGLSKKFCLDANLKVSPFTFFKELLRDQGLSLGRYDSRLLAKEETKIGNQQANDPSDDAITPPFLSTVSSYLNQTLGVKTNLEYHVFGPVRPWTEQQGSYSETASDLRNVLSANKHLRVLYMCGYYDMACPFYATIYSVNQMGLDAETRSRISYAYYPAGHMMYTEKGSRAKFHSDAKKFVEECLRG
jgi:carboxypeptidase C (cathepsin A)